MPPTNPHDPAHAPVKEDAVLAAQLTQSLQVTQTLVEQLLGEIRNSTASRAELGVTIRQLEEQTASLNRAVRGQNGDKGLLTRVELIETEVTFIRKSMEAERMDKAEESKHQRRFRWDLIIAVVGGVFGIVGAIISLRK